MIIVFDESFTDREMAEIVELVKLKMSLADSDRPLFM